MKTTTLLKLAGSSLVLGIVAVGCTANGGKPASLSSITPGHKDARPIDRARADRQAAKLARSVSDALKAHRPDKAIPAAEQMVGLSPTDANYRALLGQAYLLGGRFQSAGQSFHDAVTLDPDNGRAALSLALSQIAVGQNDGALATLDHFRSVIPQADLGLALALAGDRQQAVSLLEAAAHAPDADAKTRQNLALSYALSGRWTDARATAAKDVSPAELDLRMMKWANFSNPRAPWDQVAMLLNVTPHADMGQPARLALAPSAVQAALAAAEPQAQPAPAIEAAPFAMAEVVSAPASTPEASLVSSAAEDAPVPPPAPSYATRAAETRLASAPMRTPLKPAAKVDASLTSGGGQYVVQLGAYSSTSRVAVAWNRIAGRMRLASSYTPASTTFASRSLTVHRLSIAGFESRGQAVAVCEKIRASGGDCFVRASAGDAPVQWVSREQTRLASR
ncbi:SPOR domain-containing protein [Flavisphingomonas formosensis]|uniref:SPOR domain-containing protein n=1 Tax=Flavisphingomonas formosensis TaxID=861534 RepID=UPI0012F8FC4F|nr:SPOR domain-containing protein [Sphingomonas formosensis]